MLCNEKWKIDTSENFKFFLHKVGEIIDAA